MGRERERGDYGDILGPAHLEALTFVLTDDPSWFYGPSAPFSQEVTYTHSGATKSIYVIFYRAGILTSTGNLEVQNAQPQARCKTSDISSAARGDTLVIDGTTYYVTRVEPINTLETVLYLSLDA